MEKDIELTDVIFRVDTTKDFKGQVFALLPHDVCDFKGNVTHYAHNGQHGAADYNHCIKKSIPATPEQYNDLKEEMESIGYNFRVIKRRNYDKYLKEYYATRKEMAS